MNPQLSIATITTHSFYSGVRHFYNRVCVPSTSPLSFISLLVVSYLFFAGTTFSQVWELQSPLSISNDLNAVKFIDSTSGWAVGAVGTILHTTDSGVSWSIQNCGLNVNLLALAFPTGSCGWVVGGNGTILHTSNSGANWNIQNCGTLQTLQSVSFVDSLNGWISGDSGKILHTTNGGTAWNYQNSETTYSLRKIVFTDTSNSWTFYNLRIENALGTFILHTTDGGVTWSNCSSMSGNLV